jgi:hypothetical protein
MAAISSTSSSSSVYAAYLAAKNANVPKNQNSNLVNTAAQLSENSGLISTLYGSGSDASASSAVDELNSLVNPYANVTNPFSGSGGTAADEQSSLDQQILGGAPTSSVGSTYNSSGSASKTPVNAATDWATLMQQNPSLASAVSGEALNQSILSKLSTYA